MNVDLSYIYHIFLQLKLVKYINKPFKYPCFITKCVNYYLQVLEISHGYKIVIKNLTYKQKQ